MPTQKKYFSFNNAFGWSWRRIRMLTLVIVAFFLGVSAPAWAADVELNEYITGNIEHEAGEFALESEFITREFLGEFDIHLKEFILLDGDPTTLVEAMNAEILETDVREFAEVVIDLSDDLMADYGDILKDIQDELYGVLAPEAMVDNGTLTPDEVDAAIWEKFLSYLAPNCGQVKLPISDLILKVDETKGRLERATLPPDDEFTPPGLSPTVLEDALTKLEEARSAILTNLDLFCTPLTSNKK